MQVIDRYITKELFRTVSAVAMVLILIIVSNRVVYYLTKAAEGSISGDIIFILLGLKGISLSIVLLPPAYFFAILITLGRMYRDNEMVVLNACGIGTLRLYKSLLYFTLPFAVFVGVLSLYVAPWTVEQAKLVKKRSEQSQEIRGFVAGRFNEFKRGDVIFYVEKMSDDQKQMHNIFIQNKQHDNLGIISSKQGYQYVDEETGDRFLVLVDGNRYVGKPGEAGYQIIKFDKYAIRVQEKKREGPEKVKLGALSTLDLLRQNTSAAAAEFQWRLSAPFSIIALAFLAVPLSRVDPREGRYGRLFVAILVYVIYSNLSGVAKSLVETGEVPYWIGIWWVHLLVFAAAMMVMSRNLGLYWLLLVAQRKAKV